MLNHTVLKIHISRHLHSIILHALHTLIDLIAHVFEVVQPGYLHLKVDHSPPSHTRSANYCQLSFRVNLTCLNFTSIYTVPLILYCIQSFPPSPHTIFPSPPYTIFPLSPYNLPLFTQCGILSFLFPFTQSPFQLPSDSGQSPPHH